MNWKPTNKWYAARVVALTSLAVLYASNGWSLEATVASITLTSEALLAWLIPNNVAE